MTTLILGASGATGRLLTEQLLQNGHFVKVLVRSPESLPENWLKNNRVHIIEASINDLSLKDMAEHLNHCDSVACCLGHNLTLKGIYGQPRQLVTDAVRLVVNCLHELAPATPVKFVLMNTAGNPNRDLNEPISIGERFIIFLLRLVLPPHPDNEKAADYLRKVVGQKDPHIEWVVVRPDTLLDKSQVSEYDTFASPIRSALFNPGKTSRINVGHFMASLISDDNLWNEWKGQMPVIYNKEP